MRKANLLLSVAAVMSVVSTPAMTQDRAASFATLIAHACLFPTTNLAAEVSRAQASLKGMGLPVINETPEMGLYGDMSGAFATVAANRGKLACTVQAPIDVLTEAEYHTVAAHVEGYLSQIYPNFRGGHNPPHGYGWFAGYSSGEELVITIQYDEFDGLNAGASSPRDQ